MDEYIRGLIVEFDKAIDKTVTDRAKKLANNFQQDFPVNSIMQMNLDDYVVGKQSKASFCYRLENELKELGDIHGSNSSKFGIYYSKSRGDYAIAVGKFGNNLRTAFDEVKNEIIKLINAGDVYDKKAIRNSKISPMFRGKILYVYFPYKFLNIFSEDHLDYFIFRFGIPTEDKWDLLDKQNILLQYKNDHILMVNWDIHEYMKFLYNKAFGRPKHPLNVPDSNHSVEGSKMTSNFPDMDEVICEEISLSVAGITTDIESRNKDKKHGKYDPKTTVANKILGNRGEDIVIKFEEQRLKKIGMGSKKIKHIAKTDDCAGYDILSYNEKGEKIFIEVKSTKRECGFVSFDITHNEYEFAKSTSNHWMYIVYKAHTKNPKICRFNQLFKNPLIVPSPIAYRVKFNGN